MYFWGDKVIGFLKKRNSWSKIRAGAKTLISKMNDDNYLPDVIVGVGRAGSILAALISGNLKAKKIPVTSIDLKYEWENEQKRLDKILNLPSISTIQNKRILICSGHVNSGNSMKLVKKELLAFKPIELKTAALFVSPVTSVLPDYHSYKANKKSRMPWHIRADYNNKERP